MSANANYKYLLEDIEEYKKRDAEKSVTLNEAALKQQRDADDQKTFERNNLKRIAVGLPALKKGEVAKPEEKKLITVRGAKNNDLDFLKVEAGQILTDYISLDNKITSVTHP
jgi:carboxyl-terminal processing protease